MNKTGIWIDGSTYVLIAFFGALSASMGSDEAAKWMEPVTLFWVRTICGAIGASLLAVKMFRSTSFANHLKAQEGEPTIAISTSTTSTTPATTP